MSVLLSGATVVASLHPPTLVGGDVLVSGGRVAAIGIGLDEARSAQRIECSGCLVVPGNVCAHTHAYSALARGMPYHLPPPTSFLEILQRVWWRLDRALDLPAIRASGLVAAREALLAAGPRHGRGARLVHPLRRGAGRLRRTRRRGTGWHPRPPGGGPGR